MKHLTFILIFSYMAVILSAEVNAQNSPWRVKRSDDGTVIATVALGHSIPAGTLLALMNVGFAPKDGCRPELGIAMLRGGGYGAPIGKISPPRTEPVIFTVDETPIPTPAPFLVKYDNGLEAVFAITPPIMQALVSGTTATAQLVPGTPKLEFPISGAGKALDEASDDCRAHR